MHYDSKRLLVRAALGAACVLSSQFALAQERTDVGAGDAGTLEELTVSASRIEHSGFQAPTPVSVLDASQVEARGATNIANIINEIPAFTGSITPSSTGLNSRQNGVNAVDLRGLGPNRNLVLLNGRRGTPFDEFGIVDLNAVPSLAIGRVEVVTGGASAAWGSDAISGVVNLIYDEDLEGLKFNAQYGQSEHGDAQDTRLAAAWGSSLNEGRGHVLLAADYNKNKGVPEGRERAWQRRSPALVSNPANQNRNDGIPAFMFGDNAALFLSSPNGVTLPLTGTAADNLEFFPDGSARPRQLGEVVGDFMLGGSGSRLGDRSAIFIPTERFNVLATLQHEITDGVEAFVEASFAQSESTGRLVDAFAFGIVGLEQDNAYLPPSVAAIDDAFVDPLPLFRTFEEVPPISSESKNENMRFVAGLRGNFGDSWKWNVSGQYGKTEFSNVQPSNLLPGNLVLAADAVRDTNGNIVCRANLNGANGAPGCVPINLFGRGSPSQAALDYVFGRGTSDTEIEQTVFAADVGGELFDAWAGPVLGSFGVEYREEKLDRTVNDENANGEFLIVNAQPLEGKFDVTEAFAEFALPVFKTDQQSLDLNAAARLTDYSTVGSVETWKFGLVYSPIDQLRFRGTFSRDIRAPSIGESFVKTVLLFSNLSNPFLDPDNPPSRLVQTPTTGNPNLKEESADTTTFGVVYSAGGFRASLDWYHIDLTDTIGALAPQDVVNRCFGGETSLCDLITFEADGRTLASVEGKNINLGTFDLEGIDLEVRYRQPLGNGDLQFGLMSSYLLHKEIAPSGGRVLDVAGEVGAASGYGTPDLKITFSAAYDIGAWGVFGQVRHIGSGVYDATYGPEDLSNADNDISSITYVDLSTHYDLTSFGDTEVQIFGGIDNVFDKDPPVIPLNFISNAATNGAHYDVIGRRYYVGARVKF